MIIFMLTLGHLNKSIIALEDVLLIYNLTPDILYCNDDWDYEGGGQNGTINISKIGQ